jgi:hypothetical protein
MLNILELKTKSKIEDIGILGKKAIDLNPKEKDKLIEFLYDEMESYKDKYLKSMLTPRIC